MDKITLEGMLVDLELTFEAKDDNVWVITGEEKGLENVVLMIEDSLLIIRVNVMDIPEGNKESFFETLLRLNASSLVHGAYALEESSVILIDTLETIDLSIEELRASLDAISLALVSDYEKLSSFLK